MTKSEIMSAYDLWLSKATKDKDLINELKEIESDFSKIEDAFYRNLEFGTGGIRGIIGAGTNRMNVYTVAKVSQGLANYVIKHFQKSERKIAISYDSRIKSDLFSKTAAEVFAGNGIKVKIFPQLMPTPCLSFAVRELGCAAGIMVTASHNPSKYNGYKVYGADGCQITTNSAEEILSEIEKIDIFCDCKMTNFEKGLESGEISWIDDAVYDKFIEKVKAESVLFGDEIQKDFSIVYTPLNGTGLKPVLRALRETGFKNINVVKEQESPDGNFPTCPYPNPETKEAMEFGIREAKRLNADLLLATDPDCDRVGIAVKNSDGKYILLTGNQTGTLLFDYICSQRQKHGKMPFSPVVVKTIVTTDLIDQIAQNYGVGVIDVLTGFKFIGEQIGFLEKEGKESSYIFGFEESYGYLSGTYVRDKDAVNASMLICEMFAFYKSKGINFIQKLNEIYEKYGYCLNTLHSYTFEGNSGFKKMQDIMSEFRNNVNDFVGEKVIRVNDYLLGIDGLPKSNVLKFFLEDNSTIVIRPSGTEPKLKLYVSVRKDCKKNAELKEKRLVQNIEEKFLI